MGLSHKANFRSHYLDKDLALGLIERTIPDEPNSKKEKYRKTKKAKTGFRGFRY